MSRAGARALPLAIALLSALGAGADFAPGSATDSVPCAGAPGRSYALYLPPEWSPGRALPILFVLDARGRGALARDVFRPAAARLGWIVASSNNSASEVPARLNAEALDAMWRDTQARFAPEAGRRFVAGFSGTARFAALAGLAYRGSIAGVFGAGAAFPNETPPRPGMPFAYFGTVGDEDFNFAEVRALDRRLDEVGTAHRIAFFEGGHRWPPPDVAEQGLVWLEACASGKCPPTPAAAKEAAKKREREAEEDQEELADLAALDEALSATLRKDPPPPAGRALRDLKLERLKERAGKPDPAVAKPARRRLAWVRARAGFVLAGEYESKGDAARAALCRAIAEFAAP